MAFSFSLHCTLLVATQDFGLDFSSADPPDFDPLRGGHMENETKPGQENKETQAAKPAPVAQKQRKAKKATAPRKPKAKKPAKKTGKPEMDPEKFAAECVKLYKAGTRHISDLAVAMGYKRGTGQNRCANALIRAGLYRGHRKATA